MKHLIIVAALALAGCKNGYTEKTFPVKPEELNDCKFFELSNDSGGAITVARCPNSATTTQYKSGKTTQQAVVIDGVTYTAEPTNDRAE